MSFIREFSGIPVSLSVSPWRERVLTAQHHADPVMREALLKSAKVYLDQSFEQLCKVGAWPRIFIWHNYPLEMCLASALTGDPRYYQKAFADLHALTQFDDLGYHLFSKYPPHGPGLLVVALGIVLQAFGDELREDDTALCYRLMQSYCLRIDEDRRASAWGDKKPARLMWNHSIVGYAALYFGGFSRLQSQLDLTPNELAQAQHWYQVGREKTQAFILYGLTECGVNREGLSYAGMTLKAVMPCVYQEALANGELDRTLLERLHRYTEYVAFEVVPEGATLWNYNDSYMNPLLALNGYWLAAELSGQQAIAMPVWRQLLGDLGNQSYGADPKQWRSSLFESVLFGARTDTTMADLALPNSRYFAEKGYVVYRDSWQPNAFAFTFSCGMGVQRIHQQSDHNSFTLALDGRPVIIDTGPCNKKLADSFSQSGAHQSILVDGKGMALCGGSASTSGVFKAYAENDVSVFMRGDARKAYNAEDYNPVKSASRSIWVLKTSTPVVVIRDFMSLGDDRKHDFEWLLHTPMALDLAQQNAQLIQSDWLRSRFVLNDVAQQTPVLSLHFFTRRPRKAHGEVRENPKAYDDQYVINHRRLRFPVTAKSGLFWVVLLPEEKGLRIESVEHRQYDSGKAMVLTLNDKGEVKQFVLQNGRPAKLQSTP
ncbi:MAG: heparinase II/III-family protein [Aliidiomarina sp.]|uniref:heparinase II/III domain-containing protein n=1 Tax=Aliidiomarina sp. TaxID=1872439 RepID=UPI0025BFE6CE|nr:heparinase II/III family protein [Aliidiomarina sp.]MCH8502446.1 heparinase II/III-family protein [Aliidiomarina sp.]